MSRNVEQDLREALLLAQKIAKRRSETAIELYKPYPKQQEFLLAENGVKVLLGGNRCLGGETMIQDMTDGAVRRIDEIDSDFRVKAWDGSARISTRALRPFRKEKQDLYRFTFEDETEIVASKTHLFLTQLGWTPAGWLMEPDSSVTLLPQELPDGVPFVWPTKEGVTVPETDDAWGECLRASACKYVQESLRIVSVEFVRNDYVWDFTVPIYHNYFIGDVLNHNTGKTHTGAFEVACHLTGRYPEWWNGYKFAKAPVVWVCGETARLVRDTLQAQLVGRVGKWGTGMIPKDAILFEDILKNAGVTQAIDIMPVKHVTGDLAYCAFKTYDQGRERYQGEAVDLVWMDEEPPAEINDEACARVIDTDGRIMYTFTPLSGVTKLYDELLRNDNVHKTWLTWDDVGHLSQEAQAQFMQGRSEAEIQARKYGLAIVGTGKVFQFAESEYTCEDFKIPKHWPQIGGLDIGLTHPTAAVTLRLDEESDIVYVDRCYRVSGKEPIYHAQHLIPWNAEFALSKDAYNASNQTKKTTASVYEHAGLRVFMCDMSKGSVEASIHEMRSRIATGRFFIFKSCEALIEEMRLYRANESGIIVKRDDDLLAATRYALLALSKATVPGTARQKEEFTVRVEQYQPLTAYEGA